MGFLSDLFSSKPQPSMAIGASASSFAQRLSQFPLTTQDVRRLIYRAPDYSQSYSVGAWLKQRRGMGLEFREMSDYVFGQDVRFIDWPASARSGRISPLDLKVRHFESEEQLSIAVVLDLRPSLFLPEGCEKALIAGWLALTIAAIAREQKDRLKIITLSAAQNAGLTLENASRSPQLVSQHLVKSHPSDVDAWDTPPVFAWEVVERACQSVSSLIFITDGLYTAQQQAALARLFARQTRGNGFAYMLCLDSWAYERQFLMTTKPRGFGLKGLEGQSDIKTLSLSERYLSQVQGRQTQHYQDLAHLIEQQGGLFERVRWPAVLPTDSHDPTGALFRQILQDLPLFRLWAGR